MFSRGWVRRVRKGPGKEIKKETPVEMKAFCLKTCGKVVSSFTPGQTRGEKYPVEQQWVYYSWISLCQGVRMTNQTRSESCVLYVSELSSITELRSWLVRHINSSDTTRSRHSKTISVTRVFMWEIIPNVNTRWHFDPIYEEFDNPVY